MLRDCCINHGFDCAGVECFEAFRSCNGNRVSSTDATAYDIVLVGAKRLELKNGEVRLTYTRVDK